MRLHWEKCIRNLFGIFLGVRISKKRLRIPNKFETHFFQCGFIHLDTEASVQFFREHFKRSLPRGIFVNLSNGWKQKVSLNVPRSFLCRVRLAFHCDVLFPNRNHPLPFLTPDGTTHPLDLNYPGRTLAHTPHLTPCLLFPLILLLSLFSR